MEITGDVVKDLRLAARDALACGMSRGSKTCEAGATEIERLRKIIGLTDEEVAKYGDRAELVMAVEVWVNKRGGEAGAEKIVMATIAAMHNAGWRPPVIIDQQSASEKTSG